MVGWSGWWKALVVVYGKPGVGEGELGNFLKSPNGGAIREEDWQSEIELTLPPPSGAGS